MAQTAGELGSVPSLALFHGSMMSSGPGGHAVPTAVSPRTGRRALHLTRNGVSEARSRGQFGDEKPVHKCLTADAHSPNPGPNLSAHPSPMPLRDG
jgi:hypothetical protein